MDGVKVKYTNQKRKFLNKEISAKIDRELWHRQGTNRKKSSTYIPCVLETRPVALAPGTPPRNLFLSNRSSRRFLRLPSSEGS